MAGSAPPARADGSAGGARARTKPATYSRGPTGASAPRLGRRTVSLRHSERGMSASGMCAYLLSLPGTVGVEGVLMSGHKLKKP